MDWQSSFQSAFETANICFLRAFLFKRKLVTMLSRNAKKIIGPRHAKDITMKISTSRQVEIPVKLLASLVHIHCDLLIHQNCWLKLSTCIFTLLLLISKGTMKDRGRNTHVEYDSMHRELISQAKGKHSIDITKQVIIYSYTLETPKSFISTLICVFLFMLV